MPKTNEPNDKPLELAFDIDDFTLEEMEIIEVQGETPLAEMGTALQSLGDQTEGAVARPVTKLLRALAFIALRRRDGDKVTWADAGKIKFTTLIEGMEAEVPGDPTLPPPPAL